jgi:hypothetical protein
MVHKDLATPDRGSRAQGIALLATTLWAGSLWAIGYVAAPVLFATLPDNRMLAGMLAGRMFTATAYIGLASAGYLLLHYGHLSGMAAFRQTVVRVILLMLLLDLVGQFGLQPLIADLKAQAFPGDVMQSTLAGRFRMLHGIAAFLYAAQSLLGIVLVLKTRRY